MYTNFGERRFLNGSACIRQSLTIFTSRQRIKKTKQSIRYFPCLGKVNTSDFCRKIVQGVQPTKSAYEPRMSHEYKMVNDCFLHTHTNPTTGENNNLPISRQLRSGENAVFHHTLKI